MCVFVVINILHEVSMSFLFYSSVAFNFTTYHEKKYKQPIKRTTEEHPVNPGDVKLFKYTTPIEGKVNTWKVTLRIEGKDFRKTSDIILVIDTSGSMRDNSRLVKAKEAARNFINTLLPSETTRIGIVTFANDYTLQSGLTNRKEVLLSKVNRLFATGGTFTQSGIRQAQELLKNSGADNKHIVLLSDGEPTFSYKITNPSAYLSSQYISQASTASGFVYSINGYRMATTTGVPESQFSYPSKVGAGNAMFHRYDRSWYEGDKFYNHGNSTIAQANFAKNNGQIVWSVALEAGAAGESVLRQIASEGKYYKADPESLNAIFGEIAGGISAAVQNASVRDVMGIGFEVSNASSLTATQGTPKYENGKITWNPGTLTKPISAGSDIKYAELTYTVEINDDILKETPDASGEYQTNKEAQVTYTNNKGEEIIGYFPVPSVNPVLYTVEKELQDYQGNTISKDQTFKVRVVGEDAAEQYNKLYLLNTKTQNKRVLTSLRDKATYSFSEEEDSDRYDIVCYMNGILTENKKFTINSEKDKDVAIKVVNKEKAISIPVEKVWKNYQNEALPSTVTVNLKGKVGQETKIEKSLTFGKDENGKWKATFEGLPKYSGTNLIHYSIKEDPISGYTSKVSGDAQNGFVVTNIKDIQVSIKKMVTGNMGERDKKFNFTCVIKKGDTVLSDITFSLKHDEVKKVMVPFGCTLTVTEQKYEGYTTKVDHTDGVTYTWKYEDESHQRDFEVVFENDKTVVIPTGVREQMHPMKVLLGTVFAFGIAMILLKTRNNNK